MIARWPACHVRARWCRCLEECCPGGLADRIGELSLPFVGRVLVDQRGADAAVAHAVHQLAQARARVGVEGVPGMTQVVEVDAGQASPGDGGQPGAAVEVAMPQRRAHRAGEDERLVVVGVEALEMVGQLSLDDVGEWHGAPSCSGLRRPER